MKALLLPILVTALLLAGEASDAEIKLKIRETQLAMAQLVNQYRDLQAGLDKQIAELSKKLGCPVDSQTLTCPKVEPVK